MLLCENLCNVSRGYCKRVEVRDSFSNFDDLVAFFGGSSSIDVSRSIE